MKVQPTEGPGRVEFKTVGTSGQISLGKKLAGKTLRVERRSDGSVLLTAVAMVPESQLWTLREPDRSRIERGLAWAAKTPPRGTPIEDILSRSKPRAARPRGRRS